MSLCCSQCGTNGHNSCTSSVFATGGGGGGSGEIMLFGVRVKVDPMRKSVSMNNLSQYEQPRELANADVSVAAGYASADDAVQHQNAGSSERKRGVPWTEEEHKLFLLGLQKVGKGDWRGISRNFVKTRTPTQVASHAQKYFLRRNNLNRRRRRSSLFDITTDSVMAIPMEEEQVHQDNITQPVLPISPPLPPPETSIISEFPVGPVLFQSPIENPLENLTLGYAEQASKASKVLVHPIPVLPMPNAPTRADLDLSQKVTIDPPSPLSLKLSLSSNHNNQSSSRYLASEVTSSFNTGESIISVA